MSILLSTRLRKIASELISLADALQEENTSIRLGQATYNRGKGSISRGKRKWSLTRSQCIILNALLDNAGACVSRDEITCLLFGKEAIHLDSRTVDTQVCKLRQMLGDGIIQTIHTRGYAI